MKRIALLCIILTALTAAAKRELVGSWNGELNAMGTKLPIVLNFTCSDGKYEVTADSPAQGVEGIPGTVQINGALVTTIFPSLRAKYTGWVMDEEIRGAFEQNGIKFPLNLKRGGYQYDRPQTPTAPFPYETEEVTFTNPSDGAVLSGTLTYPVGYRADNASTTPVVVMVSGSGQQNRDEELMGHKPFAVLADALARQGIASLRYDDRSVGGSTGALDEATTLTFAGDASAAIDYLRSLNAPFKSVGVIGHSEGGSIGYKLGADGQVDFIVSIAGPTMRGSDVLLYQNRSLFQLGSISPESVNQYLEGLKRLYAYMEVNPAAQNWEEETSELADLTEIPTMLRSNYSKIIGARNAWIDNFLSYDPGEDLAKVKCPVLLIGGAKDVQVDADANMKNAVLINPSVVTRVYPGLNHLMQKAERGDPQEYGVIKETISPNVIEDVIAWIKGIQ